MLFVWIVIGVILEARDLVDAFGKEYQACQAKAPMLMPVMFRTQLPDAKAY